MLGCKVVEGSTILFLVCSFLLCCAAGSEALDFIYTFSRGPITCTDNFPKGVVCKNLNAAPNMNTGGKGDSRHSNIISSRGVDTYALGFQNATFGSHYLAIYHYNSETGLAGNTIWRATREASTVALQVPDTPSLIFTKDGNLELWSRGVLRWSLGTNRLGVRKLQFTMSSSSLADASKAGNLVLYNDDVVPAVVWQSNTVKLRDAFTLYSQHTPNFVCSKKPSLVSCTPSLAGMTQSPGDATHTNIISSLRNSKFALGFERTGGGFFLSIYRFNPSPISFGPTIWRAKSNDGQLVKVDDNATFTIGQGTLVLKNTSGKQVWAAGTIGGGYWLSFDYDSGNLMLKTSMNAIVWQSQDGSGKGNQIPDSQILSELYKGQKNSSSAEQVQQ
ncbi:hypothetical protein R1sor_008289 [Riccia sorocarpa]|uniref:Bulb-type lectin domain-containing protein n=1 Tax=Riccia sorocarpa TaxID=122646 RepID=A0ABD3HSY6_9MARC